MYNPETALGTIQRTKTNKTKGVIKNVQSRDSIGHNTKNKDKQNKRGNQECTIQRQHWAKYKEQRQTKQKSKTQNTKNMSNTDLTKKLWVNTGAHKG